MPIHDLGYRAWQGRTGPHALRAWVIAQTGIRLAWKSHWLRRMLLVAWMPAIGLGFALFFYEFSLNDPTTRGFATQLISQLPNSGPVARSILLDSDGARHEVWAFLLLTFFRYPQGVLMVLLVALVAPPLISRDMRSRAFLLYFSRPLGRIDYVIGKSIVVWAYLAMITTAPAMVLYVVGVFLSPDLSVIGYTWDLPLRILLASVWLIVPTTTMALCFSSLTSESRYAGFAWVAVWALGWVAYVNLTAMDMNQKIATGGSLLDSRWTLVSLYHSLGRVQTWVFGLETEWLSVLPQILLLIAITAGSFTLLLRRVASPMRI